MRRFIAVLFAAFAVCGTLVAGFSFAGVVGKSSARATAVTTIQVQAYEYNFTLSASTAPAGTVAFQVKNTGKDQHDFAIAGQKTPYLDPGQTYTLTINNMSAGQYNYACTIGEHASFGMQGTFNVTGAATTTTQVITTNGTTVTTTATTTATTPPPPAPVQTVAVTEKEFKIILPSTTKSVKVVKWVKRNGKKVKTYVTKTISTPKPLKAGLTRFVIKNVGKLPHNFVIQNQQSLVFAGGKTGTFEATLKPGVAKFECTITGHAALGMRGSVVVK